MKQIQYFNLYKLILGNQYRFSDKDFSKLSNKTFG